MMGQVYPSPSFYSPYAATPYLYLSLSLFLHLLYNVIYPLPCLGMFLLGWMGGALGSRCPQHRLLLHQRDHSRHPNLLAPAHQI
jgi:hypothetical protein